MFHKFTPAASDIINLILSDIGRPVGHIVTNLIGYGHLVADMQSVLNALVPKEVAVQTTKWPHPELESRGRADMVGVRPKPFR
ncbi:MAG: PAS domain-containing protein [Desulfatirhabdiaceae bacterium]